ncbi:hypothetical protein ACF0H5_023144 [Mactra antiquata]
MIERYRIIDTVVFKFKNFRLSVHWYRIFFKRSWQSPLCSITHIIYFSHQFYHKTVNTVISVDWLSLRTLFYVILTQSDDQVHLGDISPILFDLLADCFNLVLSFLLSVCH